MTEKNLEYPSTASSEYENGLVQASFLSREQYRSLQRIESGFRNQTREDGKPVWFAFSEYGFSDEVGNTLALYNDFHRESEPDGWQLWVCPPDEEEFQWINISECLKTDFAKVGFGSKPGGIRASFQLGIAPGQVYGGGFNDVLNVLCYDTTSTVRFWSHQSDASRLQVTPGLKLGGLAAGQCRSAA